MITVLFNKGIYQQSGDANELINQAKEIIIRTETYQNLTGNTRTPTSGGP